MAEIPKPNPNQSFLGRVWDNSKPPPGEEGVLGPVDQATRFSYKFTKPAAIGAGIGTAIAPAIAPLFFLTAALALGDKALIETSKAARVKLSGDMKPGEPVNLPKSRRNLVLAA